MSDRYTDTESVYSGSNRLPDFVQAKARPIVAGAMAILILATAVSLVFVQRFSAGMNELKTQNETLRQEKESLMQEKDDLAATVSEKAKALDVLDEELSHIEVLVGLTPDPEKPIHARIHEAGLSAVEKRLMLDSIPSGYPVEPRDITSGFGKRVHPVTGRKNFHRGVDLRSPRGAPVYATADGVVESAANHRGSGWGKMVKLTHNYGFATLYAHLDEINVERGGFVQKGDKIGLVGNTGLSTAPHLHYEVHYLGRRFDPEPFMAWSMEAFYEIVLEKHDGHDGIDWQALATAVRRNARLPQRHWFHRKYTWSLISPP